MFKMQILVIVATSENVEVQKNCQEQTSCAGSPETKELIFFGVSWLVGWLVGQSSYLTNGTIKNTRQPNDTESLL